MTSKNSADVAGANKITYILLWQFFNTNKFKKYIYHLLLHSTTFQGRLKIGRSLSQLHKTMKNFTYQIQDGW